MYGGTLPTSALAGGKGAAAKEKAPPAKAKADPKKGAAAIDPALEEA